MTRDPVKTIFLTIFFVWFTLFSSRAQWQQHGNKLVGTGGALSPEQGGAVGISANGNTLIVGGAVDSEFAGAAWIYTFNGTDFAQSGKKLLGQSDYGFGNALDVSADGKTFIISGTYGSTHMGAAYVYTFNGTGFELISILLSDLGFAQKVHISADGRTALVIGYKNTSDGGSIKMYSYAGANFIMTSLSKFDVPVNANTVTGQGGLSTDATADGKTIVMGVPWQDDDVGATRIYTYTGSAFEQSGDKLFGAGAMKGANNKIKQGNSVSISSDGKIVLVGGLEDDCRKGAAWVFTFNGTAFQQLGSKLVGTGAISNNDCSNQWNTWQGSSVNLSADGMTAVVSGYGDDQFLGAAWIYTFNGATFVQAGSKLVGTGNTGEAWQGFSTGITEDGKTVILGGLADDSHNGAIWVFVNDSIHCHSPGITQTGSDVNACTGTPVAISVSDTGSGLKTYRWYKNDTLVYSNYSPEYRITSLIKKQTGRYTGVVSNGCGSATSPGINITGLSPQIIGSASQNIVCQGESVTITGSGAALLSLSGGYFPGSGFIPTASGIYTLTGLSQEGCMGTAFVTIVLKSTPVLTIAGQSKVCLGSPVNLSVLGANTYIWSNGSSGSTLVQTPETSIAYIVTGTGMNGCSDTTSVKITVNNLPETSLHIEPVCDTLDFITLAGGIPAGGRYRYQNHFASIIVITITGHYPVSYQYTDLNQCTNTATGILTVDHCTVPGICDRPDPPCQCTQSCPSRFRIYTAFSPNQDGINETWIIDSLTSDTKVTILDKWSNEVFQSDHYQNDWNGTVHGQILPFGLYYYVVELSDKKRFTGTVSIIH